MHSIWGRISTREYNWNLLRASTWLASCFDVAIFFKRLTNFRNDEWLRTFEVVVGEKLVDVTGRILQTPSIIYGKVGVSSADLSSVIYAILIGYEC